MILAGRAANVAGVPVVLDPVGVGSTVLRTDSARLILGQVSVAIVRGNAAEAATLAGQSADIRGVESMGTTGDLGTLAGTAARVLGCIVAVTGPVDAVSDGHTTTLRVANGHPMLATVSGTGCIASAISGCFAAVNPTQPLRAAVEALVRSASPVRRLPSTARAQAVSTLPSTTRSTRCRRTPSTEVLGRAQHERARRHQ